MPPPLDYRRPKDDPPSVTLGERVLATIVAVIITSVAILVVTLLVRSFF